MFEKKLFIANKIGTEVDNTYGNEIIKFDKPKEFHWNYQPTNGYLDYQRYGGNINGMYTAIVPLSFLGKVKPQDRAYLMDGETYEIDELMQNDDDKCSNANYEVVSVLPQNLCIKIDFKKINK